MKKWFLVTVLGWAGLAAFGATGADLYSAVKDDNPEKVMRVLASGVDNVNWKDKTGSTALIQACLNGNLEIVETLLRYGASVTDIDDTGWFPLLAACSSGNADLVDLVSSLDQARISLGVVGHGGWTPLSLAASKNNRALFQVLLKNGAPLSSVRQAAADEVLMAAGANAVEILDLLKAGGAGFADTDPNGMTALHFACQAETPAPDAVRWLLAAKADPNAADAAGRTPLSYAAEKDRLETVKDLLKAGASPKVLDKAKKRPADYAKNPDVVKLLK